jgi:glycosyltransferase involved in cell wall biosynthesis
MRILFLTDNFPPEVNAPATRTYEHCREWVKQGVDVTVITCFPNFPQGKVYDGYKNVWKKIEWVDGIKVIRVWSFISANQGFLKRIIDYVSFGITSFFAGLFEETDLIVATSPQFFTAVSGRKLAFWKRVPWVMEVRDLWPESIKNVNAMNDGPLIKFLEWEEKLCYQKAKGIVTVTDTFKTVIEGKGIKDKIKVVKNGANLELFHPKRKNTSLIKSLGLEGKFVVGYIGTHGMAHKLDFILHAVSKVTYQDLHFLFIGDGAEKKRLIQIAEKLNLKNVSFLNPITKKEIPDYISIIDVALIPLKRSELFKTVIPSKIFENAAMQKPILLGVDGESRGIVEKYKAGLFFEPENESDFFEKIKIMKEDSEAYKKMQEGCAKLALDFNRIYLAQKMLDYLNSLVKN